MSGKREKIIQYITALPAGAKVSVRNLARELDVSEGTAYSAIKHAEELKLVETRARAGTVRLQQDVFAEMKPVTLASQIGRLGLGILTGAERTDVPIGRIVLGDGSLEQFKASLQRAGERALCIVGDRPDLLFFAASHGVNIILTNGTQPGEALLATADEHSACVLASMQDSSVVWSMLRSEQKVDEPAEDAEPAGRWMRSPPYLYYNDVVADWYNSYRPIFSLGSKCAVVDDEMHICGTLDAARVLSSSPSVKISSLYAGDQKLLVADESTPMHMLAQLMIAEGDALAYITRGEVLCGVVTANDALRYYQYNPAAQNAPPRLPTLERLSSSETRSIYAIQLGGIRKTSSDLLLDILNIAAKRYCSERFGADVGFTSGSFYTSCAAVPDELMVSCELQQNLPAGFVLEVEMYDETNSYARCITIVAPATDKQ